MAKKKGRTFPYFDVDLRSLKKTGTTMVIVDRNSIQEIITDEEGKPKRVYVDDVSKHIAKKITIPAATDKERKNLITWMLEMKDPRYTVVYDHRRNSFHVEYAYNAWLEYLKASVEEEEEEE